MIAALVFLVAFAVPIVNPGLPRGLRATLMTVQDVVWAIFLVDYVYRVLVAPKKWEFVRKHPIDLAAVALPALRPLRLVAALSFVHQVAGEKLRGHVAMYVAVATILVVTISSLAVLNAERGEPGASIETWQDALWWSFVTVTTVGYGDYAPVTAEGRLFAVGLMLCGIALLGIVTASLASWLIERIAEPDPAKQPATAADVTALTEQVRELRAEVLALRGGQGT
ncbi:Potassium voltage-gated channel subfamily KQT [Serinicoccus hydrothermalis]|uniref:Potassium voltage-gated channel subfamily KQT n=2 Tax=Serinicoccus hydrothermalis TaxID=1758689 RepID=A0A1B1N9Y6_9MICO|nr:Potassium voltage-gated channel subfamily KQT [Serinicoccus hydrothermalis]